MFHGMIRCSTFGGRKRVWGGVVFKDVRVLCKTQNTGLGKHEYCKGNHHGGPFAKIQNQYVSTLRGPSEVSKWMSLMVE